MIARAALLIALVSGCYSGTRVVPDINDAWRGRTVSQIQSAWGTGQNAGEQDGLAVLAWRHVRRSISLPSGSLDVEVGPNSIDARAELRPGVVRRRTTEVIAFAGPDQIIREVRGPSLRWGPPNDANIHWGFLLGIHAGMGSLDDTSTPLPSGGLYIGGMISRQLGLVGSYSMSAGSDDAGGAMAFAWAFSPQYWIATRLWVRAGPAMILAFDPGFENAGLEPGVATALSYAVIKAGTFALDLRLDLNGGSETRFGSLGIGVNIN